MSGSGSRASRNRGPKGEERHTLYCQRSERRLSETVEAGRRALQPSATSTHAQLTQFAQAGSQQSPISARVDSFAEQVGSSTSMSETQLAARQKLLERDRVRSAKYRASRAAEEDSAVEAPPQVPMMTEAMTRWDESSPEWAKDKAEFDRDWDPKMNRSVFDGDDGTQGSGGPEEWSVGR